MKLNRTFAILVCAIAFLASATAGIAGEAWRVVQTVGTVKVGGGGLMPVALTNHQTLPSGAWVETSPTGRVLLVRGQETIAVAPMSRVQLPEAKVNGNTQVLQSLGSVFYQIGKELKPHFQVDTPYLAAVVKGTAFTVTVENGTATVDVTEGLVEVVTPDHSDAEFVRAGFTATVREHDKSVTVDETVAPAGPAKPDDQKSTTRTIVIPEAIGEVTIDMKKVTGGLIDQPLLSPAVKQTIALNAAVRNGLGNDNDGNGLGEGKGLSLGDGNGLALGDGNGLALGDGNGLGLGDGNGLGLGNGNGLGLGDGNGLGLGDGNGLGLGDGNGLGLGDGNGLGLGDGNGLGLGDGNGLGLGLGNGDGPGLGLGNGNGLGLGLGLGLRRGS